MSSRPPGSHIFPPLNPPGSGSTPAPPGPAAPIDSPVLVDVASAIGAMAGGREEAPSASGGGSYLSGLSANHEQRIRQLEAKMAQLLAQAEF